MSATFAFAVGIRNTNGAGLVLDCLYPSPVMNPDGAVADAIATLPEGVSTLNDTDIEMLQSAAQSLDPPAFYSQTTKKARRIKHWFLPRLTADNDISSTEEAYLKLHLLSHRSGTS